MCRIYQIYLRFLNISNKSSLQRIFMFFSSSHKEYAEVMKCFFFRNTSIYALGFGVRCCFKGQIIGFVMLI